ncbi:hypothetical protein LXA43DRAFT_1116104 [Ganoderma leucocontextum]|nr:hypothetical protein LXA43DRAFT_1116104 [Ganoderma leucocontextum]
MSLNADVKTAPIRRQDYSYLRNLFRDLFVRDQYDYVFDCSMQRARDEGASSNVMVGARSSRRKKSTASATGCYIPTPANSSRLQPGPTEHGGRREDASALGIGSPPLVWIVWMPDISLNGHVAGVDGTGGRFAEVGSTSSA